MSSRFDLFSLPMTGEPRLHCDMGHAAENAFSSRIGDSDLVQSAVSGFQSLSLWLSLSPFFSLCLSLSLSFFSLSLPLFLYFSLSLSLSLGLFFPFFLSLSLFRSFSLSLSVSVSLSLFLSCSHSLFRSFFLSLSLSIFLSLSLFLFFFLCLFLSVSFSVFLSFSHSLFRSFSLALYKAFSEAPHSNSMESLALFPSLYPPCLVCLVLPAGMSAGRHPHEQASLTVSVSSVRETRGGVGLGVRRAQGTGCNSM